MRILFLTANLFLPDHVSAQNRTLRELAAALVAHGHEAVVLAKRPGPPGPANRVVAEHAYGFRLLRADDPVRALPVLNATLRPEVAIVVDGEHERMVTQCRSLRIPMALWFFHAEPYFFRDGALDNKLMYLATSSFLAARVNTLFGVEARVLPPYIEREHYSTRARGKRVLFVNPVREKGVEIAFALAQERPSIPFTFVESWGMSELWRQDCFDRALRCGNIEWVPKTIDRQALLANTHLLLLPRASEEGCCRLVAEAQLGGIPVLASKRGNLSKDVGRGGTLVELDAGVEAWLQQLDRYFEDDELHEQTGTEAISHASRPDFAPAPLIERLLHLLGDCIGDHRSRRWSQGFR